MSTNNITLKAVVLATAQSTRRAELENTIASGLKTFADVGTALAEIPDTGLYKMNGKNIAEAAQRLAASVTPGGQSAAKAGEKKDAEVTNTVKAEGTSSSGDMDANKNGVAVQPSATSTPLPATMSPTTEEL